MPKSVTMGDEAVECMETVKKEILKRYPGLSPSPTDIVVHLFKLSVYNNNKT